MSFLKFWQSKSGKARVPSDRYKPVWRTTAPGKLYSDWPRINGEPETPAFLKHCTSLDLEDEIIINMLHAYGIPAIKQYPSNGSFGKVILGMSGEGTDIFVPESMLSEANSLIGGYEDELH